MSPSFRNSLTWFVVQDSLLPIVEVHILVPTRWASLLSEMRDGRPSYVPSDLRTTCVSAYVLSHGTVCSVPPTPPLGPVSSVSG